MHPAVIALLGIAGAAGLYEGGHLIKENSERNYYWSVARAYSNLVEKPLLVVGMRRWSWQPPDGDVTVDIDPQVLQVPGGVQSDERIMPFEDKQFGAVFNPHTLEHLASAEDVELAVNECLRVAEVGMFLCPSPYSIIANLFCPGHNLRLWFDNENNRIIVRHNSWRTGLGEHGGGQYTGMGSVTGQAIIGYTPLKIPAIVIG